MLRRSKIRSRFRGSWLLLCGLAFALLLAVGLTAWLYAGPASAQPGATCNPLEGHGQPGCHVGPTTATDTGTTGTTAGPETTDTSVPDAGPQPASDSSGPVLFVDENNCLSCHGDPLLAKQQPDGTSISLYVSAARLTGSIHRYQDCTTCHTTQPHDVPTELSKLSLAQKCGSCHQYQYSQYVGSVHGADVTSGNSDPASCTDCHSSDSSPHTIKRVLDQSASTYPKNIAQTCAKCHDDPQLMGKYGIVERVYDSYMRSFHGKVMSYSGDDEAIGKLNTATCVNCHGSHSIASTSDPDSPVAGMENLAKTCEQCHPGAGVEFASGFLGHKEADPGSDPQVYWGERFFYWFTRSVLGAGFLMVAMPVGRLVIDRVRGKGGSRGGVDETPEEKDETPEAKDE